MFPHSGLVTLIVPLRDSTIRDVAVVGREGILGGFAAAAGVIAMSDAHVHISGSASRIAAEAFSAALENSPRMRRLLAHCESAQMAQTQQSAICNATHSVEARICRWLLEIRDRCDSDRLLLTQSDLAAMLGVRRTTVTLVAGRLQNLGAIKCRRGFVYVTDREMLEQYSCECYGQVKDYVGRLFRDARETAHLQSFEQNTSAISLIR